MVLLPKSLINRTSNGPSTTSHHQSTPKLGPLKRTMKSPGSCKEDDDEIVELIMSYWSSEIMKILKLNAYLMTINTAKNCEKYFISINYLALFLAFFMVLMCGF